MMKVIGYVILFLIKTLSIMLLPLIIVGGIIVMPLADLLLSVDKEIDKCMLAVYDCQNNNS